MSANGFKEAPYSVQYMSVFWTKNYLNLKKLIFAQAIVSSYIKRVILTPQLLLFTLPWQHDVTICMASINQKSRLVLADK
jgi:hypothetical protein